MSIDYNFVGSDGASTEVEYKKGGPKKAIPGESNWPPDDWDESGDDQPWPDQFEIGELALDENGNSYAVGGPGRYRLYEGRDAATARSLLAKGLNVQAVIVAIDAKQKKAKATEQPEKISRKPTDIGNAERFAAQHGADVRYCYAWKKWIVWDSRRWRVDDSGEIERRAKLTARSILVEAAAIDDSGNREEMVRWAKASEKRDRLNAMIALAQSEQPIPIAVESLDAEPWLLNCENGTVDLRTGELQQHQREDFLTKLCPLEYPTEPGVDPDLWLGFLDRIFAGNAELIAFVQRLLGMSLVGDIFENVLPIFYGSGSNGKSVLQETWCGVLGLDYGMAAPDGFLVASKHERHPTEIADLHGRRFVSVNETADGGRLSESLVKRLTSRERMRARRMKEDFWEFKPTHTIVLATNHKPVIRGTDNGIWRRLRLVPFTVTIPDEQQDKNLADKLKAEYAAILQWAVTGCIQWQCDGMNLGAPEEVMAATETYRAEQDTLGEFIEECCHLDEWSEERASRLYWAWQEWCKSRGEWAGTQTAFGLRLTDRGFGKDKPTSGLNRNKVVYNGIRLDVAMTERLGGSSALPSEPRGTVAKWGAAVLSINRRRVTPPTRRWFVTCYQLLPVFPITSTRELNSGLTG